MIHSTGPPVALHVAQAQVFALGSIVRVTGLSPWNGHGPTSRDPSRSRRTPPASTTRWIEISGVVRWLVFFGMAVEPQVAGTER
jgi:hypothetical protein